MTTTRLRLAALTAAVLVALTACSSGPAAETGPAPSADDAFPVRVEHAFGATEITEEPQRVVTWGWGSADAAIALGVVPVAMAAQPYGGDAEGVLPWVRERLEADGEQLPEVLPDQQEPPIEAIAAAEPDLVLAPYSGITADEYELLSQVAPTVAYPEAPWATPWRETVEIVGASLGRAEAAEELLDDIDAQVAEQAEAHPELAGLSVALVFNAPDAFYVYKPADARVDFTLDLGLTSAESVEALSNGDQTFFYTLSRERLDELDSDVLVSYADTPEASRAFLSSPEAQLMEQVREGRVAEVVGTELIAAVSPPTALSLTWGLEDYVTELGEAAVAAGG
ncbi:MAG: iron-siderophore ABC transporter substrate-binding protein [Actinomycetes bacterium]